MSDLELGPVTVPPRVYEGLDAVRRSARVSMGDVAGVWQVAWLLGYPEVEDWLKAHEREYAHGIFWGFRPMDAEAVEG